MTRAGLRNRLKRLSRARVDPKDCEADPTFLLFWDEAEPKPEVPADAPRCPRCGRPHIQLIRLVRTFVDDVQADADLPKER
jgi:hypothetical protein